MEDAQGYNLGQKVAHIVFILPIGARHKATASCTVVLVMEPLVLLISYINIQQKRKVNLDGWPAASALLSN